MFFSLLKLLSAKAESSSPVRRCLGGWVVHHSNSKVVLARGSCFCVCDIAVHAAHGLLSVSAA
jgi:hypothetical protein